MEDIEFTMRLEDYQALGGHMDHVMPLSEALNGETGRQNDHVLKGQRRAAQQPQTPWPVRPKGHGLS